MAGLIYSGFTSLDGYVADADGHFDWAPLDAEVLSYIHNRERRIGTYLFGRKVYETMSVWDKPDVLRGLPAHVLDYLPIWQAAEKIVYSTSLQTISMPKARLERTFDPDIVRELKARATRDLAVGGATLGAQAIRAGLVDEFHLLVAPTLAGGGTPYWPRDVKLKFELVEERRFNAGLVYLQYHRHA